MPDSNGWALEVGKGLQTGTILMTSKVRIGPKAEPANSTSAEGSIAIIDKEG